MLPGHHDREEKEKKKKEKKTCLSSFGEKNLISFNPPKQYYHLHFIEENAGLHQVLDVVR